MNILYGDIEEELSAYTTTIGMIRKIVLGTLNWRHTRWLDYWSISTSRMFRYIWSDLSFDQVKQRLDNLQISDG